MVESAETFGKYRLLDKVAVGGMAEIYRAKTVGMGGFEKLLAIKRIHPQFGEEDEIAQMLVDEARIAVHLTHPNIAQIFDLGCIDGQYFIAMEFIDGVDLHQIQRTLADQGRSIPVAPLVFIVAEALGGLHYAHTRTDADGKALQIVHRDVSPQNIMISHEGEVKLVDFGIAKAEMRAQQETQHGIIKGKFYYMSPEQAHAHHVDARTDIFAAGMVLYEMLAGDNPYGGIEEYQLLKAVRRADFPPVSAVRPDVDDRLVRIVTRATRRDANYRFESARQMQLALMEYLDHHSGAYRRMELGQFIRGFHATDDLDPDGAIMSRVDYEASEASMIFDAGTPITQDVGQRGVADDEPNPFEEDQPTQLWTGRENRADDVDAPSPFDAAAPAELSSPQFLDISSLGDEPSRPKTPTARRRLTWRERLPAKLTHPRVLLAAMAAAVLVLAGILGVLLLGGEDTSAEQSSDERVMDFAADEAQRVEPVADSVDQPQQDAPSTVSGEAVVLKVTTYPPDGQVSIDGEELGRAPVDAVGLSRDREHEVVAEFRDGQRVSRSVRWRAGDDRVKQLELNIDQDGAADDDQPPEARQDMPAAKAPSRTKQPRRRRTSSSSRRSPKPTSSTSSNAGNARSRKPNDSDGLSLWEAGGEERVDASKGYLDVRIRGEAKIYVDGELVSDETTRLKHQVAPGSYQVRVFYSRLKRYSATKTVAVSGGESSRVFFAP